MDDLGLIETKAHAFIEESKDLDSLAKAANILRDIDEQRKIRAELEMAGKNADRAASEHTSDKIRFWTATLLPTLAFLVTAGTFLYQIQQGKVAAQAQEDSQWRLALEKIAGDSQSAPIGALEMQSFFNSSRYDKESRPVAATLLPKIDDLSLFDVVFFDLLGKTTKQSQQELIVLARSLTSRLRDQWSACPKASLPADNSFAHFLKNPEDFYDDNDQTQGKEEMKVDADEWKLDSVIHGLTELWQDPRSQVTPRGQDLAGIAFLNGNYKGVDFRGAQLSDTAFYGKCNIDGAKFDSPTKSMNHCEP